MAKRTIKTATVCGMQFQGETVSEAKAKGEKSVTKFVAEAHRTGPAWYRVGDLIVLIWPVIDGWEYQTIEPGNIGGNVCAHCSMGGTRADAVADAVFGAVQRQWTLACVDDAAFIRDGFAVLLDSRDTAAVTAATRKTGDMAHHCLWQRRYAAARDAGADDCRAHDIACRANSVGDAIGAAL